jgi:hypothetical protein
MDIARINFNLVVRKGAYAQLYVNDLPLLKRPLGGPDSFGGGLNHLLVPGENRVAFEVHRAVMYSRDRQPPPSEPAPPAPGADGSDAPPPRRPVPGSLEDKHPLAFPDEEAVGFMAYTVLDETKQPLEAVSLFRTSFPACMRQQPPERWRTPCYVEQLFALDFTPIARAWWSAPRATFGCGGTPQMHEAVAATHAALGARDLDGWLSAIELEVTEYAMAFGTGATEALTTRRSMYEEAFAFPLTLAPLEPAQLHFEARAGGRVAQVTRHDGRPVLDAMVVSPLGQRIRGDLLLTQHEGRWRVM